MEVLAILLILKADGVLARDRTIPLSGTGSSQLTTGQPEQPKRNCGLGQQNTALRQPCGEFKGRRRRIWDLKYMVSECFRLLSTDCLSVQETAQSVDSGS
jgi:hypothetical protein